MVWGRGGGGGGKVWGDTKTLQKQWRTTRHKVGLTIATGGHSLETMKLSQLSSPVSLHWQLEALIDQGLSNNTLEPTAASPQGPRTTTAIMALGKPLIGSHTKFNGGK